jgi:hypothetical protein
MSAKTSTHAIVVAILVSACSARSEDKVEVEALWTPDVTHAQWVYTSSTEVGTKYEAKRYHWIAAAKQVGKLTIVPRLDDSKNAQPLYGAGLGSYKSTVSLAAYECATGRTYTISAKRYTYYEGGMGQGRSMFVPSSTDDEPWTIGTPPGEGIRSDMTAVCSSLNKA